MRRSTALLGGFLGMSLLTIVLMLAQPLLLDAYGPGNQWRSVGAGASEPNWRLAASYKPGLRLANVLLQMDNMERRPDATYRLACDEAWMPTWEGRLQGRVGDFVRIHYSVVAPQALDDSTLATALGGCRVELAWSAGEVVWPQEYLSGPQGPRSWPASQKTITFASGGSATYRFSARERLLEYWLSPWTRRPYPDDPN